MKIQVDTDKCSGQARCEAAAPTVFQLNEEGYNDSDPFEVGEEQLAEASRGVLACPEMAITMIDDDGEVLTEEDLRRYAGFG